MSNEDYGHGFAILPIVLYLIWRKKEVLLGETVNPSKWGVIAFILWIFFYAIGSIGHISTIVDLSMILFLLGAFAVLLNIQAMKAVIFPVFFMVFMFPIPSEIYTRVTNPLMLLATSLSFRFVSALNIPILMEGNLLSLPNYSMQVVNACSGIRSLMMIMALSLLIGYIMTTSNLIRVFFFLISLPIAIFDNIFRISTTILLAYFCSPRVAEGFAHMLAGIVVFIVSLVILYGCMELILWFTKTKEP
jgi:exosortase